jgi:hypothetical protein
MFARFRVGSDLVFAFAGLLAALIAPYARAAVSPAEHYIAEENGPRVNGSGLVRFDAAGAEVGPQATASRLGVGREATLRDTLVRWDLGSGVGFTWNADGSLRFGGDLTRFDIAASLTIEAIGPSATQIDLLSSRLDELPSVGFGIESTYSRPAAPAAVPNPYFFFSYVRPVLSFAGPGSSDGVASSFSDETGQFRQLFGKTMEGFRPSQSLAVMLYGGDGVFSETTTVSSTHRVGFPVAAGMALVALVLLCLSSFYARRASFKLGLAFRGFSLCAAFAMQLFRARGLASGCFVGMALKGSRLRSQSHSASGSVGAAIPSYRQFLFGLLMSWSLVCDVAAASLYYRYESDLLRSSGTLNGTRLVLEFRTAQPLPGGLDFDARGLISPVSSVPIEDWWLSIDSTYAEGAGISLPGLMFLLFRTDSSGSIQDWFFSANASTTVTPTSIIGVCSNSDGTVCGAVPDFVQIVGPTIPQGIQFAESVRSGGWSISSSSSRPASTVPEPPALFLGLLAALLAVCLTAKSVHQRASRSMST